jgi:hypothetical protein
MVGLRVHPCALRPRRLCTNGASQRARAGAVANPLRTCGLAARAVVPAGVRTEVLDRAGGGGFYKAGPVLQDMEFSGGAGEDACGAELTNVVAFDRKRHAFCCYEVAAIPGLRV